MSGYTGTWSELLHVNTADYTALANTNSEGSLLTSTPAELPTLQAFMFQNKPGFGRSFRLAAAGIVSCTGTPTLTFQVRLGTTAGPAYLSGTSIGVSAAITLGSGITNQFWWLYMDLTCYATGTGSGKSTLSGAGRVGSEGGFAAPYGYYLLPSQGALSTWTSTFDNSVAQYLNLSATWSAMSSSNTITTKQCWLHSWN